MSDKDETVDMSEVAVADSAVADDDATNDEMGQLKSKIKKLKSKKNETLNEDEEDFDFELESDGKDFMCGVVEGFYGRPWTTGQRKELFGRMKSMGMNTYLYGPKDDYKHRLYWRELYSPDETDLLKVLIESAEENDVLFIYAISPGLDMAYASPKEVETLKNKLLQVRDLGCKAFALLFDDIDPILSAADKEEYKSAASAQASITNQMHELLNKPKFLFCPTEYCNSMALPDVVNSLYLATIGRELNKNIPLMWTGPKVVSKNITVESIKQLTRVVRRKVVIWDNIHANDYDPKRVFLGPYKGRSTDLIPHLAGVLTNPNCEFESNYIAMHTLSSWWKSYVKHIEQKASQTSPDVVDDKGKKSDVEMAEGETKKSDSEEQASETEKEIKAEEPNDNAEPKKEAELEKNGEENAVVEEQKKDEQREEEPTEQVPQADENEDSSPAPQEGGAASAMSSGVSSYAGSDDSDTDSDYSSHDEYFSTRRIPCPPAFDHGVYDPDESLKEAIKSWLPLFSTCFTTLGKPVARSGPPLGMLPQFDVPLTSSAPMGQMSTTSVLSNDPILSTTLPTIGHSALSSPPKTEVEEKHVEAAAIKHATVLEDIASAAGPLIGPVATDVEMSSSAPNGNSPREPDAVETSGKQEAEDKPAEDVDVDMKPVMNEEGERGREEKMQTGDSDDSGIKRSESSAQMDTEEEEPMQYEADQDSDVSMATNNSVEEKKTQKEDSDDKEAIVSLSGSSVEMTSPPHNPPSLPQSPQRTVPQTPEHQCYEATDTRSGMFRIESMTLEDVELAVELFYLPYEHGNIGRKMVRDFIWLQQNVHRAVAPPNASKSVKNENLDKALKWMERAIQFEDSCVAIRRMCNKLTTCSNRALLYDLFPYFWDIKGVVSMLSSYIKWLGQFYLRHQTTKSSDSSDANSSSSKPSSPEPSSTQTPSSPSPKKTSPPLYPQPPAAVWLGSDPEPWVFRGGLSGEFQRLLPITMANDLFCQVIPCSPQTSNTTYVIRPYLPSDEKAVYNMCLTTGNDGTDFADDFTEYKELPGERLVGGLLTLSPEYCFVVEDEHGICGYLIGTPDAKSFWKKYTIAFLPEVKEKYSKPKESQKDEEKLGEEVRKLLEEIRTDEPPDAYAVDSLHSSHPAYMQIAVHRRVMDPSIAKTMTVCMLSALKSHGVHGVHTTVRSSDCYMPDLYSRLGFHEIRPIDPPPVSPGASTLLTYKDDTTIIFGRTF